MQKRAEKCDYYRCERQHIWRVTEDHRVIDALSYDDAVAAAIREELRGRPLMVRPGGFQPLNTGSIPVDPIRAEVCVDTDN